MGPTVHEKMVDYHFAPVLFRDDAKTARSPMGGRGVIKNPRIGHKKTQGKGGVINF